MSTTAQYASTPVFGAALLTTADTSLTAPTTVGTVLTAGSNGTRIDYIDIQGVANTVAGIVNLFIYDGTNYHLCQKIQLWQ
jgi:diphthamide biosynthesis methyltransferase